MCVCVCVLEIDTLLYMVRFVARMLFLDLLLATKDEMLLGPGLRYKEHNTTSWCMNCEAY